MSSTVTHILLANGLEAREGYLGTTAIHKLNGGKGPGVQRSALMEG